MEIKVTVPGLLADCTGGRASFMLSATTLQEAVDHLFDQYPLLKHHVFTELGQVRKHVLLCYNKLNIKELDHLDVPLRDGDQLFIMQLVSGG